MSKPLVSVIVPAYNASFYIEEGLLSLVNQTWPALEIIVVDDGSTDDTAAIVNKISQRFAQIRLHRKINGGVSSARNSGIDLARGEFIAFQDSDDRSNPDRIEKQLMFLQNNDLALCGCALAIFGRKPKKRRYPQTDEQLKANLLFFGKTIPGAAVLYKKECAKGIRFNEAMAYGEDLDFILRIAFRGNNKVGNVQEALYQYRQHGKQATARLKQTNRQSMITMLSDFLNEEGVVVSETVMAKHFDLCRNSSSSDESLLAFYSTLLAFYQAKGSHLLHVRERVYQALKKGVYSGSPANGDYLALKKQLSRWQRIRLTL